MTEQEFFHTFMSEWPTWNIATIMTAIMVPASGYHNTTMWYGNNPVLAEEQTVQKLD